MVSPTTALLVPREMKVEHSQSLKSMTDEELDEVIAAVRAILDERAKQGEIIVTPSRAEEPELDKKQFLYTRRQQPPQHQALAVSAPTPPTTVNCTARKYRKRLLHATVD
jgi:hypothetical protein